MHQQTLFVFVFFWLPWAFYVCEIRLAQAGTFSEAAQTFMTMNALAAAASCLTLAKVFMAARGPDSRTRFKRRINYEVTAEDRRNYLSVSCCQDQAKIKIKGALS